MPVALRHAAGLLARVCPGWNKVLHKRRSSAIDSLPPTTSAHAVAALKTVPARRQADSSRHGERLLKPCQPTGAPCRSRDGREGASMPIWQHAVWDSAACCTAVEYTALQASGKCIAKRGVRWKALSTASNWIHATEPRHRQSGNDACFEGFMDLERPPAAPRPQWLSALSSMRPHGKDLAAKAPLAGSCTCEC